MIKFKPFDYFSSNLSCVYLYLNKIDLDKHSVQETDIYEYVRTIEHDRDIFNQKYNKWKNIFLGFEDIIGAFLVFFIGWCILCPLVYYVIKSIINIKYLSQDGNVVHTMFYGCAFCYLVFIIYKIFKNEYFSKKYRYFLLKKSKNKSQYNPVIEKIINECLYEEYLVEKKRREELIQYWKEKKIL